MNFYRLPSDERILDALGIEHHFFHPEQKKSLAKNALDFCDGISVFLIKLGLIHLGLEYSDVYGRQVFNGTQSFHDTSVESLKGSYAIRGNTVGNIESERKYRKPVLTVIQGGIA